MSENDPAVGFDEVLAVVVDFARSRAAVIEGQDFGRDPFRVKTITDGVGAERGDENIGGTNAFPSMERKRDVGEGTQASDREPNEL
jgi:hypothetical protein